MEGVINLRGKIVSVIDLRKRFNQKQPTASRRNRILVVEHKGRLCGLIVDSATEVIKIAAADVAPSTTVFQDGKGRLIVLLDVSRLLDFGRIETATANHLSTEKHTAATAGGHS